MRLYAISDIHLSFKLNSDAFAGLDPSKYQDDGLILAGDVGESVEHLNLAFQAAKAAFKHVFWVPGNHELYTSPHDPVETRGLQKYQLCVEVARSWDVLTPEDDFVVWEGDGGPCVVALLCTLYDYTFRPPDISREGAVKWAEEEGICATDELLLHPDPYPSRDTWCEALCDAAEEKLRKANRDYPNLPVVLVNHWPLREDLITIPAVPRFSIWCGTKRTRDWHREFNAKVVVTGHLHVRRTDWIDGVRFEECSLGYPKQWKELRESGRNVNTMMREILPGPPMPPGGHMPTIWRMKAS